MNMPSERPALDGITVIDLTQALAGPYCTQILGDLGAEVIKIERPGIGDQSRGWGPPFLQGESSYFIGTNRNKKSVTLDLSKPETQEVLYRLVDRGDVLIHNIPRVASQKKLGIDAETICRRNPRMIWAGISGFGMTGPEAERPGYDVIAQGMSGTMALTGDPGSGPIRFPTPMADITTGMYATMGILTALFERERSGLGQVVDLALLDSQTTWLSNIGGAFLATGEAPKKRGNIHPNIAPYQPFRASDGWFILAAGTESLWQQVVSAVGEEATLGKDPRFSTNADRVANRLELERLLEEHFSNEPVAHWIKLFQSKGVPCGPILSPEDALRHPHLNARDMVLTVHHPAAGDVQTIGNPIKLERTPPRVRSAAPLLGADTEAVLSELGYTVSEIASMNEKRLL